MYGEINWLKQHIVGMGGEVSKCFSETVEERRFCRENLEVVKMKVDKKG